MTRRYLSIGVAILIALTLLACNSANITSAKTDKIEIAPLINSLPQGIRFQMSATAFQSDGSKIDITQLASWSTSDKNISTIDESGSLLTLAPGTHNVVATYKTLTSQKQIVIEDDTLVSLNINPTTLSIAKNTSTSLNVIGVLNNGATVDVTSQVTWQVADNAIVTLNEDKTILGVEVGQTQLTATLNNLNNSSTINVVAGTLNDLEIGISGKQLYVGDTTPLRAIGMYAEGYKQDVSQQVSWQISDNTKFTVNNETLMATALLSGDITVTATLDNIAGSKTVSIAKQAASLTRLEIVANDSAMSVGENRQFKVFGYFSDNSKIDFTHQAIWSSDNETLIQISNNIGYEGNAIALQTGSATLSASIGNLQTNNTIVISPAELLRIELEQQHPIPLGTSVLLTAIGIYADDSARDISQLVTWQSANEALLHVSNENNKQGTITALRIGTARITASLNGISDSDDIVINSANLISINIEGSESVLYDGQVATYQAVGIFSDGTKQDISHLVIWDSSDDTVIAISNNGENSGVFSILSAGTVSVSASYKNISQTISLKTLANTVDRLVINSTQTRLPAGNILSLEASAIYSNNASVNITTLGDWLSLNEAVIRVSNSANSKGKLTAIATGSGTIQIQYLGVVAELNFTISDATLNTIEISPQNTQLINQTSISLTATGIYSDNSVQDITQQVIWSSDKPDIISVSNALNEAGDIRALSPGNATISASINNLSSSINIPVTADTIDGISILFEGSNTLAKGTKKTLTATGNYASGTSQDLTQQVTWQSVTNTICTVSNANNNAGILIGLNVGSCTLSARFSGTVATTSFTISNATLMSITLSPTELNLANGTQGQLQATGVYSDASVQDLSSQVIWSASSPSIASMNNSGLVTALSEGSGSISASYLDVSTTTNITVSSAILQSIEITPTALTLNETLDQQLIAIGRYSDESTQNITQSVIWESANNLFVAVSNESNNAGFASALSAGTTTITATLGSLSDSINATIELIPTAPKSIALSAAPYVILDNGTDTSTVTVKISAVDNNASVADGSQVNLSVLTGTATLDKSSTTTSNGQASFTLQSSEKGVITVKVTLDGTDISNVISVYSTDNFGEIVAQGVVLSAKVIDNVVQAGSQFGLAIVNYANRPFTLLEFRVFTQSELLYVTSSPETLNNNTLNPGEYIFNGWETEQPRDNTFVALYLLSEPSTGSIFPVGVTYTLPANN